jgi:hypothetical protein
MGPLIIGEASQTAIDYCTLADIEAYSGVTFSDGIGPTESEIATMISNASRLIDAYIGEQQAGQLGVEEWFDTVYFGSHIVLGIRPVQSITSIISTKGDGSTDETLVQSRARDSGDYWLSNGGAGIVRFNGMWGEQVLNRMKVTYVAGNTSPPAKVKMATIFMVVKQAARAALNDENCMDRIKEMWERLLDTTSQELDWLMRELKKEQLVGVATFGTGGAY